MNCHKCRYVLPDTAKFCRSCGEVQVNVTELLKTQSQISEYSFAQSLDHNSHEYLSPDKAILTNNQLAPLVKKRKKRKILLLFVLIILLLFVFAYLSNNIKDKPTNSEQKEINIVQEKPDNEKQNSPIANDQEIKEEKNDTNLSDENKKSNDETDTPVKEEPKKAE